MAILNAHGERQSRASGNHACSMPLLDTSLWPMMDSKYLLLSTGNGLTTANHQDH